MREKEIYHLLIYILEHVRHIERLLVDLVKGSLPEIAETEEILKNKRYAEPVNYPVLEDRNLRELESRIQKKFAKGEITITEFYSDATELMMSNLRSSNMLLNLFTSSGTPLTLKSECPQCGGHLVLRVDENAKEIYLTCLDKKRGGFCSSNFRLATY